MFVVFGHELAVMFRAAGVSAVRFVATSASRDAGNRDEFIAGIRERLGVEPEVISGDEEAQLSFDGATGPLVGRHEEPFLVVDLGGGSTEFVLGSTQDGPIAACSVNIGCVRITERHGFSDPPSPAELQAALADIDAAIAQAGALVPFARTRTLVGLAGTVTTVAAQALGLSVYAADAIDASVIGVAAVDRAAAELISMRKAERAALGFMHPGRVDVIGAGALIWRRIVAEVARAAMLDVVVTSEHDILDGMALALDRSA